MRKQTGVTLIELLITVVIVGILAAFAYPAYTDHITRTRRTDAHTTLNHIAAKLEKYFFQCNSYYTNKLKNTSHQPVCVGLSDEGLGYPDDKSANGYYVIAIDNTKVSGGAPCTAGTCYTLTATPVGDQLTKDANTGKCRTITLDSAGVRGSTGTATDCWGKK